MYIICVYVFINEHMYFGPSLYRRRRTPYFVCTCNSTGPVKALTNDYSQSFKYCAAGKISSTETEICAIK